MEQITKQRNVVINIDELNDEVQKWLQFLLSVIDLGAKSASESCKLFFTADFYCCYHNHEFLKLEVSILNFDVEVVVYLKCNNITVYNYRGRNIKL